MQLRFESVARLKDWRDDPDILGVIAYGTPAGPTRAPWVSVPMASAPAGLCEVIRGRSARYGQQAGVRYAHDGEWLFAALTGPSDGRLQISVAEAYERLLTVLDALGYPCLIRVWQHFPDIHGEEEGLERYRQFNLGRHQALRPYLARGGARPAATCVGSARGDVVLYALACVNPGTPVENPRQISAYRYPETYGPQAPDFARAMKVSGARGTLLWISGTAAIVGHESRGPDLAAQARETCANLDAVVAEAGLAGTEIAAVKVYVRAGWPPPVLSPPWRDAPRLFVTGDICRRELLVEVEAVVSAPEASAVRNAL